MDTALPNLLKELIADFQAMPTETGTLRDLRLQAAPRKAAICIGVRRSGNPK